MSEIATATQMAPAVQPKTMGTIQAAKIIGCHRSSVTNWCRQGKFPGAHKKVDPGDPTGQGVDWNIPNSLVYARRDHEKALKAAREVRELRKKARRQAALARAERAKEDVARPLLAHLPAPTPSPVSAPVPVAAPVVAPAPVPGPVFTSQPTANLGDQDRRLLIGLTHSNARVIAVTETSDAGRTELQKVLQTVQEELVANRAALATMQQWFVNAFGDPTPAKANSAVVTM